MCDGIGGTVKRLAARASLQRPIDNQILTAIDLFEFCKKEISGITFLFVSKTDVEAERKNQEKRFTEGHTVAGTRANHYFLPINKNEIQVSRVSRDTKSFIASVGK